MKKRISIQSAKGKGRVLQQWVCAQISELTGFPWGKDQPIESRGGSQSGVDVRLEKDVLKVFPFSIECKWQESWSIPGWIEQAKDNQKLNTYWLLVCRRSRERAVVVMDAEHFFQILRGVNFEKDV